jgi:hypothetical protein
MLVIDVDFAYDGSNEDHEITQFERDYGVKTLLVGRANGWPVLRVKSSDRKVLETILADRDESWRTGEILDEDADDYDDCPSCRNMYGNGKII